MRVRARFIFLHRRFKSWNLSIEVDISLHCFYEVPSFGAFAGEGFWECSHHSDVSLWLWDLLWGYGRSLRGGGLSSSSTTWVSSSRVSLHAFIPGMLDASAQIVRGPCGSGLHCYGWSHCCLGHRCILEWYVQCWGCVDWALSDHIGVPLFFFVEVVIRV